jgi:hypothetical protein
VPIEEDEEHVRMMLGFVKLVVQITKVKVVTRSSCSLFLVFICVKDNEGSLRISYYANQN